MHPILCRHCDISIACCCKDAAGTAKYNQEKLLTKGLTAAQQRYKAYADQWTQPVHFQTGQQVLLISYFKLKTPGTSKLMPKYIGPFQVLDKVGGRA